MFAYGQSNGKSGTDSGTNLVDCRRNRMRFRFRRLSPREKTFSEITAAISCRKTLSRTPVPNLDPGNRCLYCMSRSPADCTDRQDSCTSRTKTLPQSRATDLVSGWNRIEARRNPCQACCRILVLTCLGERKKEPFGGFRFSSRNKRCSHISPQQRTEWLRCGVLSR